MDKDQLTKLDSYGHKPLNTLSKDQLKEYYILLQMRIQEVRKKQEE